MYVLYNSSTSEWSNVTIISDGPNEQYGWNDGDSANPTIAVDNSNNVHVVWEDETNGTINGNAWKQTTNDDEIMYVLYNSTTGQWSNITVISDGYNNVYWNDGTSHQPSIAVDCSNNIYVAWEDETNGIWGNDEEVMYAKYTADTGQWSNASVISDGYNNIWGWNDKNLDSVKLTTDKTGNVYAVWQDETDGIWGSDSEIMFVKYSVGTSQWSNVSVISDGYNGVWGWNDGGSSDPSIEVDGYGNLHVIWDDGTTGKWGSGWPDTEIMYAKCSAATGQWSNASVISDGYNGVWGWNTGGNPDSAMVIYSDKVHVVFQDNTPGIWGGGLDYSDYIPDDSEIMYVKITIPPPTIPSEDDDDDDDDEAVIIEIPPYVLIAIITAIGVTCIMIIIILKKPWRER
jgi:hypothetical protein